MFENITLSLPQILSVKKNIPSNLTLTSFTREMDIMVKKTKKKNVCVIYYTKPQGERVLL